MEYSVGILELKSIARGIQACDDALKSAGIHLISAQPVCPGKFELVITGELAQVEASMEKIRRDYASCVIDSALFGRIDQTVVRAMLGAQPQAKHGAIGTIETYSISSAIMAADTAVKAAAVEILELRAARGVGGKGIVFITGDLADVTAAVQAGSRYAKEQGLLVGESVIGSPHSELWDYL